MQYKATFKPIRENVIVVEADSLEQAAKMAKEARLAQVKPTSVQIDEIEDGKLTEH
jgi:hypothetical protein